MNYKILKTSEEIDESIFELSEKLNEGFSRDAVDIITLNHSADIFVEDVTKHLSFNCRLQKIKFESYEETQKSCEVKITSDLEFPIYNKHVILADGIIISGSTHFYLMKYIEQRLPLSITLISVGIKPNLVKFKLPKTFSMFNFEEEWVEGYGIGSGNHKSKKSLFDLKKTV